MIKIADNLDVLIDKWYKKMEETSEKRAKVVILSNEKNEEEEENKETEYNAGENSNENEIVSILEKNVK